MGKKGTFGSRTAENRSGFTLIEVMITVTLSALMFLTVLFAAQTGILSMRLTEARSFLSTQLRQGMDAFAREAAQSSPETISPHFVLSIDGNGNSSVRFQIPVDADGTADWGGGTRSDVVDNSTDFVQWGAPSSLGVVNTPDVLAGQWVRYSVRANPDVPSETWRNQLVREILLADGSTVDGSVSLKVIANNITFFQVTQDPINTDRLTVVLRAERRAGAAGGIIPMRESYTTQVILRNDII